MRIKLTAVYEKVKDGYIGYVEELPGANTQGATLRETKRNLKEAIELVMESYRRLNEEENAGKQVVKEPFGVLTA
ncbi:MAG: type II toxin-antitoxin system HicB family antitoxin [Sedimentisphaerales bacterium]|jgi:predicted RNase H-like HicB family nuclease|nr:type II toxin-antitoxin system HicB family antitoxin [Sedimentisphaerales bacterium]